MAAIFPIRARCSFRSRIFVGTSATIAPSPSGPVRASRPTFPRTMCLRSLAPARPPAARRRSSPSATSRSCAIAPRARRSTALGYATTIDYLQAMCALVLRETGLLPHANPGIMSRSEIAGLRTVSASQGIMLEFAQRRASANRAAFTTARRTSDLKSVLRPSGSRAKSACPSRPAF